MLLRYLFYLLSATFKAVYSKYYSSIPFSIDSSLQLILDTLRAHIGIILSFNYNNWVVFVTYITIIMVDYVTMMVATLCIEIVID